MLTKPEACDKIPVKCNKPIAEVLGNVRVTAIGSKSPKRCLRLSPFPNCLHDLIKVGQIQIALFKVIQNVNVARKYLSKL